MSTSTNIMVKQCEGLLGTKDINDWEQSFLQRVVDTSAKGKRPDLLSSKQVEVLERIWKKHFAG